MHYPEQSLGHWKSTQRVCPQLSVRVGPEDSLVALDHQWMLSPLLRGCSVVKLCNALRGQAPAFLGCKQKLLHLTARNTANFVSCCADECCPEFVASACDGMVVPLRRRYLLREVYSEINRH